MYQTPSGSLVERSHLLEAWEYLVDPGSRRDPGENSNPIQYLLLVRRVWWATPVTKESQTG